jgi:rare lipoprotein A
VAPGKTYKLQVGSFKVARNAVDTYVALREAGLNPEYEHFGEYFRVVLKGVRGTDVQSVANRLGSAGIREAIIREE